MELEVSSSVTSLVLKFMQNENSPSDECTNFNTA